MTEQELLNETVSFYNSTNRAVKNDKCCYTPTESSPGCALGKWLPLEVAETLQKTNDSIRFYKENTPEILPEWMQKMNIEFLCKIQLLHDDFYCWNHTGLNESGKKQVENICKQFGLENPLNN